MRATLSPIRSPFIPTLPSLLRRPLARPRPWTCQQCYSQLQQQRIAEQSSLSRLRRPKTFPRPLVSSTNATTTTTTTTNTHSRSSSSNRGWRHRINLRKHRKAAITATIIFVTACAGLAFSERVRYLYMACERSGRVGTVLALNVNEYRKVLKRSSEENYESLLKQCHKRCAERTLHAMEKNGSIFIKLGQHLSSMNYLLPEEWCETFVPLQDECPVSPFSAVDAMVRADTGHGLDEYFSDFQREPIGAASLAQVHVATLRSSGAKVAVKVQHPSMDDWKGLDLALTRFTFRTLRRFFPEYDLTWLSDEMEDSLPKELDFREEARNAQRMADYFSRIPGTPLIIPQTIWARRRILVMEFLSGKRPDDLAFLDENGIDRDEVSAALANIFNEMIFGLGAPLHCDPHGGNLAIRLNTSKRRPQNFDIILYDHGLYRDIPTDVRRKYAHLWLAVIAVDEPAMRHYAREVAGIGDEDFPIFASAITGRDFEVVRTDVSAPRNAGEKAGMASAMSEGELLEQLVKLLGKVPRILLLILKTNDLTRSLDEKLQTRQGPVRSFLILARYAARAVLQERLEGIRGSLVWPSNAWNWVVAWVGYARVVGRLRVYEVYLGARRWVGLQKKVGEGEEGEASGMEKLQELM